MMVMRILKNIEWINDTWKFISSANNINDKSYDDDDDDDNDDGDDDGDDNDDNDGIYIYIYMYIYLAIVEVISLTR